jgi:poly-gamma-glutamate synthesis protein (capsule biosynthesis protein)
MRRLISLALTLLLLAGCAPSQPVDADQSAGISQPPAQSEPDPVSPVEPEPEPEPVVAHLMVAGDIMSHMPLTNDCYVAETDSYDYTHVLREAAEQLALADFAVGNLETTLAGGPEYSGYPRFNSPDELAYNIKDAGFDLLCTTNNRTLDTGIDGLNRTLDVLDQANIPHVGTYRSQEERDENNGIYVADVGGISVAFLAYTYGLNGHKLPDSKPYAANVFNIDYTTSVSNPDYDMLAEDMAAARALDTDLIAVITHWGIEYRTKQNGHQEKVAQFLVEQGADLVLGGHPHVLQPYGTITAAGEDGQERQGFVIYSLGNFISNQNFDDHSKDLATKTTVILDLELTKDTEGNTTLTDVRYTPYYMVHRNNKPVGERRHLVNVNRSIAAYEAGEETIIDKNMYRQLQEALALCHEVLGEEGDKPSD